MEHHLKTKTAGIKIVKSIVTIYFNKDFEYAANSEYEPEICRQDFSALTLDDGDFNSQSKSDLPCREFHPQGSNLDIAIKLVDSRESLLQEIRDFEVPIDQEHRNQSVSTVETEYTTNEGYPKRTKSQWTIVDRISPASETKCEAGKVMTDEDTKSNYGLEGPANILGKTSWSISKAVEEFESSKKEHGDNRRDQESLCKQLFIQSSDKASNCLSQGGLFHKDKQSTFKSSPSVEPFWAGDAKLNSTPSSPIDVSIIYMKSQDATVDPEEDEANPEILEFIQNIAKNRSVDDANFLNSEESDGDLGFRESIEGGSNETFTSRESSVYDERFLGRADIFRPLLTPSERRMLGIAIVPDFSTMHSAARSEIKPMEDNGTANCDFEYQQKTGLNASGYPIPSLNSLRIDDKSLIRSSRKPTLKRMFVNINDFKIGNSGPSKSHQTSTDSRRSPPGSQTELKYLRSISPYPENKSDLKRARDEVIQTIKWQSKLDKVAGDESWIAACKSRIKSVEEEYKILKDKIKEKARRESLRKLSLEYQQSEENLQAKFITSKEMLTNEFNRKVNKLNGEYSRQGYVLGTNYVKKSKEIEKKLMTGNGSRKPCD